LDTQVHSSGSTRARLTHKSRSWCFCKQETDDGRWDASLTRLKTPLDLNRTEKKSLNFFGGEWAAEIETECQRPQHQYYL